MFKKRKMINRFYKYHSWITLRQRNLILNNKGPKINYYKFRTFTSRGAKSYFFKVRTRDDIKKHFSENWSYEL